MKENLKSKLRRKNKTSIVALMFIAPSNAQITIFLTLLDCLAQIRQQKDIKQ